MKTLKKFATLALSFVLALGCLALTACGGGNENYDAYEFVVKNADGSTVTDVKMTLCVTNEDGTDTSGTCNGPIDCKDGKFVFDMVTEPGYYLAHVYTQDMSTELELTEICITDATEFGSYTLTLKD